MHTSTLHGSAVSSYPWLAVARMECPAFARVTGSWLRRHITTYADAVGLLKAAFVQRFNLFQFIFWHLNNSKDIYLNVDLE